MTDKNLIELNYNAIWWFHIEGGCIPDICVSDSTCHFVVVVAVLWSDL